MTPRKGEANQLPRSYPVDGVAGEASGLSKGLNGSVQSDRVHEEDEDEASTARW